MEYIAISSNEYWATVGKLMTARGTGCTGWCPHFSSLWNHHVYLCPSLFVVSCFVCAKKGKKKKRTRSKEYICLIRKRATMIITRLTM